MTVSLEIDRGPIEVGPSVSYFLRLPCLPVSRQTGNKHRRREVEGQQGFGSGFGRRITEVEESKETGRE